MLFKYFMRTFSAPDSETASYHVHLSGCVIITKLFKGSYNIKTTLSSAWRVTAALRHLKWHLTAADLLKGSISSCLRKDSRGEFTILVAIWEVWIIKAVSGKPGFICQEVTECRMCLQTLQLIKAGESDASPAAGHMLLPWLPDSLTPCLLHTAHRSLRAPLQSTRVSLKCRYHFECPSLLPQEHRGNIYQGLEQRLEN